MADTVRLTIEMHDPENNLRVRGKCDVPISRVEEKAAQVAGRLARNFRPENFEEPSSVPHVVDGKQRAAGDY
jgi:hypothetical protein